MAGKRAVVFSGGGAKGGYQIGAWQALRELNYSPDIVTGTSVGAFNGALMASDKYKEALHMWENMSMGMVFTQFAEAVNNEESKQAILSKGSRRKLFSRAVPIIHRCAI